MLYILGVNIPENKSIMIGLNTIYGIGPNLSKLICHKLYINPLSKPEDLTDKQINEIAKLVNNYIIEMDLKKKIKSNIERLILIGVHRGLRHRLGLPVRGQRTRSNAKTQKFLSNKIQFKNKVNSKKIKIKSKIKKKKN